MKKSTLLALATLAMTASPALAQNTDLANPTLPDGSYIVKYDLEKHAFCEDNDFEVDETFIFAVDITGTAFVDAIAATPRNPAVLGRGMARDIYILADQCAFPHDAASANLDGRIFHIEGNIYGCMFNVFQHATSLYKDGRLGYYSEGGNDMYDACQPGAVTYFGANMFPFGWSKDSDGTEWWNAICEPIYSLNFKTKPYTGTKTSPAFFFDDYANGMAELMPGFEGDPVTDGGFASPNYYAEYLSLTAVDAIASDENAPVEYFNLQGIRVANPENGLFIKRQGKKASKVMVK